VAFRPTVTRGLAFEGNPAIHPPTSGPVAFRPGIASGLVLRQPGGPAFNPDPWLSVPGLLPVWLKEADPAIHCRKQWTRGFPSQDYSWFGLRKATRLSTHLEDGPAAFRPKITPGLA